MSLIRAPRRRPPEGRRGKHARAAVTFVVGRMDSCATASGTSTSVVFKVLLPEARSFASGRHEAPVALFVANILTRGRLSKTDISAMFLGRLLQGVVRSAPRHPERHKG